MYTLGGGIQRENGKGVHGGTGLEEDIKRIVEKVHCVTPIVDWQENHRVVNQLNRHVLRGWG